MPTLFTLLASCAVAVGCGGGADKAAAMSSTTTPPLAAEAGTAPAISPISFDVAAATQTAAAAGDLTSDAAPVAQAASLQQARVERLKAAIESMKVSQHELKPDCDPCTGWRIKPLIVMGTEPYAESIPSNWTGTRYSFWKSVLPWFVIYEGAGGNQATNSAVEINGIEMWAYSLKDRTWSKLATGQHPTWNGSYGLDATTKSQAFQTYKSATASTTAFAPTKSHIVHGGLGQVETPWNSQTGKADLGALLVSVRFRLIPKNPELPDDRSKANFTLNVGADYYPWVGAQLADLNAAYVPASGLGQFLKATPDWRHATYFVSKSSLSTEKILKSPPPEFKY
ncbi:hypothetical protein [Roseateles sp. BYS96W]|uniref:Lipoprotein n=1 Tax=Pelomonas nitida TaxID=3299027 RepID=A0ABW7G4E2_9BURK